MAGGFTVPPRLPGPQRNEERRDDDACEAIDGIEPARRYRAEGRNEIDVLVDPYDADVPDHRVSDIDRDQ